MAPLQTLSIRDPASANIERGRAYFANSGADSARGFASMLDIFSAREPRSKTVEQMQESDGSLAESAVDQAESDQVDEQYQGGQGGQGGQSSGQGDGQGNQSGGGGADGELMPQVKTTDDLGLILTNAASVDIAGMASDQLQGQGPAEGVQAAGLQVDGAVMNSASAVMGGLQVSAENAGPATGTATGTGSGLGSGTDQAGAGGMSRSESMAVLLRGAGMAMNGGGQVVAGGGGTVEALSKSPASSVTVQPMNQQVNQQMNQQMNQAVNQPLNQAVVQSRVVHDTGKIQVAQVRAVDLAANRKVRNGTQTTDQAIVINSEKSAKANTIESVGQSGNEQTGLDLGSRAQNPARILDANAIDDRAIQRQQVMAQVQRGLASILNTKGGTMKLRLSPEHLGQVNIRMTTKNGSVSIEIDAQHESTRQVLEKGLEGLRASMETRGIQVDELAVQSGKPKPSGFEQLLNDSGNGGSNQFGDESEDRDGHRATQNQQHNENESQGDQHESSSDFNESGQHTSRGIWTELGLDAIA